MRNIILAIALVAVAPLTAHAQTAEAQKTAEEAYTKGDTAYNLGRYAEAAEWFTKAYEAWPQPEFLYNIAQSYRLGGNCKQALHFYKRFKSLKEKDKEQPLSKKKAKEIDGFIKDLQDCADKAEDVGDQPPDGLDKPGGGNTGTGKTGTGKTGTGSTGTGGTGNTGTGNTGTGKTGTGNTGTGNTGTGGTGDDVADNTDDDDDGEEDEPEGELAGEGVAFQPTLLSVRANVGLGLIGAGDVDVPGQLSIAVGAGYPIAAGPLNLDVGAMITYTGIPYEVGMSTENASLLGAVANVGAGYPVTPQISARGELGLGVLSMGGLVEGNQFTEGGAGTNGSLAMFHLRFGIAGDYAITDNFIATLTPFAFAYSPAKTGLKASALTEMSFMLGVGYRM
jgi:hypothetical protein